MLQAGGWEFKSPWFHQLNDSYGAVAQWVEHLIVDQDAESSSLFSPAKLEPVCKVAKATGPSIQAVRVRVPSGSPNRCITLIVQR